MVYVWLTLAIVAEVIATTALKATDEFTNPVPSLVCVIGYATAFYLLSLVLRTMPVGIAYAIWTGLGIVLVAAAGAVVYRQLPDAPAIAGMALIIAGTLVINLFSKMSVH